MDSPQCILRIIFLVFLGHFSLTAPSGSTEFCNASRAKILPERPVIERLETCFIAAANSLPFVENLSLSFN
ncbi:hypothetical protein BX666DRAFT_1892092 [Dichotomocladium elegans]|nr:hypothetical protein BX666DRAFT_1892092 [Dichotomocladium elegans]